MDITDRNIKLIRKAAKWKDKLRHEGKFGNQRIIYAFNFNKDGSLTFKITDDKKHILAERTFT